MLNIFITEPKISDLTSSDLVLLYFTKKIENAKKLPLGPCSHGHNQILNNQNEPVLIPSNTPVCLFLNIKINIHNCKVLFYSPMIYIKLNESPFGKESISLIIFFYGCC